VPGFESEPVVETYKSLAKAEAIGAAASSTTAPQDRRTFARMFEAEVAVFFIGRDLTQSKLMSKL
jgi:hypothetical protein